MINWDHFKPFFTKAEFECKCGCGSAAMDRHFMKKLFALRLNVDEPFFITSGFRCPAYNNKVSSTGFTGPHTTGKAVDIQLKGERAHRTINLLMNNFTGIGISQKGAHDSRFMHLDNLKDDETEGPRPWIWSY